MSRAPIFLASLFVCGLLGSPAMAGELQLQIHDGRVTLKAHNATLREILAEWARIGDTKIVNAEKVGGGPVTLELVNVPERQALDTLLRSASGYMAAPRPVPVATASLFDRILVLVSSTPPPVTAGSTRPGPGAPQAPQFQQPFSAEVATPDMQAVEEVAADIEEANIEITPDMPVGIPEPGQPLGGIFPGAPLSTTFPGMSGAQPYPGPQPNRVYVGPDGQPGTPLLNDTEFPGVGAPPVGPGGLSPGTSATPGVIIQPAQPEQPPMGQSYVP